MNKKIGTGCLSPLILKADTASLSTGRITRVVPCGKCYECLKRRSNGWVLRLEEEMKVSSSCAFITYTYSDDHLPISPNGIPSLDKRDFQLYMKRLRKEVGTGIKYYACGEYGSNTHRPHYHAIMFNLPLRWTAQNDLTESTWQKGNTMVAPGGKLTFKYVTKYILKKPFKEITEFVDPNTGEICEDDRIPEFSLMSKGLGKSFITDAMRQYLLSQDRTYIEQYGYPTALPRYYLEKLLTPEERKRLSAISEREKFLRELEIDPVFYGEWKKQRIIQHKKKSNERDKI